MTGSYITAVCSPVTDNYELRGAFTENRFGIVTSHEEKFVNIGDLVNVGIYILSPQALSAVTGFYKYPIAESTVFPSLIDTGRFRTYIYRGYHRNINTPTDLLHAHLTYSLEHKDKTVDFPTPIGTNIKAHRNPILEKSTIRNSLAIGKYDIADGVHVEFCILADGVHVKRSHSFCLISGNDELHPLREDAFVDIKHNK